MPRFALPAPTLPGGPTGDQLPSQQQLALIQWTLETPEQGHGPATRAAVAALQEENGIPVDPAVMIGPRTWALLVAAYRRKVEEAAARQAQPPRLPPGPAGEQVPDPAQLALIQWTLETTEAGYGPATRTAVAALQQANGIPEDPEVMIGRRTWARILERYRTKAQAVSPWQMPAAPLRLDGGSAEEIWLRGQVDRLNTRSISDAAVLHVRNRRILAMIQAGDPPRSRVPVPSADDPEVAEVAGQLAWSQAKIDLLWERAQTIGIDPRVMLAVLFQEGTGSFNTNAAVPTQFWNGSGYVQGGSGPQPDFERDLAAALEHHILAKVRAYGHFAASFRAVVVQAGLGDGNLFQYVNWVTPWFKNGTWAVRPGCYATHTEWWLGLQRNFDCLAGNGATLAYSEYLAAQPVAVDAPVPVVQFVLTRAGTGPTDDDPNHPWIEAFPA